MALIDNLVRYFKLDENTGTTATDATGNGNATFSGAGTHWSGSGKINAGGLFSSTSDLTIPDAADLDMTAAVSVSAWVYATGVNVNNQLVAKRAAYSGDGIPFELTSTGSPDVYFSWRVVGNGHIITGSTTKFLANQWYHVVGTWDGTTMNLYVNGSLETTGGNTDTITPNSTDVHIGHLPDGSENTDGVIDEVGIWSRGLSGAEVTALYNGGSGVQYPFSAGSASLSPSASPSASMSPSSSASSSLSPSSSASASLSPSASISPSSSSSSSFSPSASTSASLSPSSSASASVSPSSSLSPSSSASRSLSPSASLSPSSSASASVSPSVGANKQYTSLVEAESDWFITRSSLSPYSPLNAHKRAYWMSKGINGTKSLFEMEKEWLSKMNGVTSKTIAGMWREALAGQGYTPSTGINYNKFIFYSSVTTSP